MIIIFAFITDLIIMDLIIMKPHPVDRFLMDRWICPLEVTSEALASRRSAKPHARLASTALAA